MRSGVLLIEEGTSAGASGTTTGRERGRGLGEDNNEPMYMIHAFCPLAFFSNFSVANYINMLLSYSYEVQVVQDGGGEEGQERATVRQRKTCKHWFSLLHILVVPFHICKLY